MYKCRSFLKVKQKLFGTGKCFGTPNEFKIYMICTTHTGGLLSVHSFILDHVIRFNVKW